MKKVSDLNLDDIVNYYETHSLGETALYAECSQPTLKKFLIKNNVILHTRGEGIKLATFNKYGVENVSQLPDTPQKVKLTKLERYGDENYVNPMKAQETNLRKYGVKCTLQDPAIHEKSYETMVERYGDIKQHNIEKSKQTILDKFGMHENYIKHMVEACKKTNLEKYGDENYRNIEKSKQTKLERYGDENYNNRKKAEKTCIDKYGVDNIAKTTYFLEKCRETWLLHGFDHPMHVDDIKNKCHIHQKSSNSQPNNDFKQKLIENNLFISDNENREFYLNNFFYDFKVNNTLIEIDPWITHNSIWSPWGSPKEKNYHHDKSKIAHDNNYKCIHIFDWDDSNQIIKLLLVEREKIYARKCIIKEVDKNEAKDFIDTNHIQGYVKDGIRIGLYYNDKLVSIMTFGKPRYNKKFEYELIRYCSTHNVIGGAEKLFKYFLNNYNPSSIISYCDLSKFDGHTYKKLGFTLNSISVNKHWYNPKTNKHITNNLLLQQGFDRLLGKEYGTFGKGTDNETLMIEHNFVIIYDSGQATYIYKK